MRAPDLAEVSIPTFLGSCSWGWGTAPLAPSPTAGQFTQLRVRLEAASHSALLIHICCTWVALAVNCYWAADSEFLAADRGNGNGCSAVSFGWGQQFVFSLSVFSLIFIYCAILSPIFFCFKSDRCKVLVDLETFISFLPLSSHLHLCIPVSFSKSD